MRPIKFRAYDRTDERIYYDVIPFGEFVVLKYSQAGYEMLDIEIEDYDLIYSEDFSDYEIMQYTGLKDKNGVEIYEGDIVREKNADDEGIVVEVVWQKGAFYGRENGFEPEYLVADFLEGEVIGNIYETRNYWRS